MKKFLTVLRFELDNYFKSKSFIISTILLCILSAGIMFAPRVIDSFKSNSDSDVEKADGVDGADEDEKVKLGLFGQTHLITPEYAKIYFPDVEFVLYSDVEDMKKDIMKEDDGIEAGFFVNGYVDFTYYVNNKSMFDSNAETFSELMLMVNKLDYCWRNGIDIEDFLEVENREITMHEEVLGKDSSSNYWYCYILVIIIFMLIIMYGMQVASSVTNEKSNRSIEILVTSTSTTAVLFGKVFASVISSIFQVGLIGLSLLGSYQVNKDYWGDGIAMFLDIPSDVLITFAVFGIGGFILYAFLYGALGALVSKIEDLNKTAGTAQMVIMIVYFVVLINLTNVDGVIIKVCSFLPISSYSAMFARVAMGSVATWEIVLSAVILYASVILVGFIGGKIFRNSTLRYGNPIKISNALKGLRKSK
ncbi:MAG: ABC transporter permease [Lachnospiraceae bacterium]|nr:ABC transporter permease [Lachnospiraceae bacterium]